MKRVLVPYKLVKYHRSLTQDDVIRLKEDIRELQIAGADHGEVMRQCEAGEWDRSYCEWLAGQLDLYAGKEICIVDYRSIKDLDALTLIVFLSATILVFAKFLGMGRLIGSQLGLDPQLGAFLNLAAIGFVLVGLGWSLPRVWRAAA